MILKRAFSFLFVAFALVACGASTPSILLEKGPCGGDALEHMCSWGGCCPNGYSCRTHGCEGKPVGPRYLGPSTPQ